MLVFEGDSNLNNRFESPLFYQYLLIVICDVDLIIKYYSFVSVSNFSSTFNKIVKMIVDKIATIKMP